jgi:signal transduction histidine kinase/CHASE2 domain-containing sensor protein
MKRFAAVLAVSAFAAALVLLLSFTPFFDGLNAIAYDFTMRLAGPVSPEAPLTLVVIDEESLKQVGRWPWGRTQLAELVDGVANKGPAALVLDIMLDDPESDSGDAALAGALGRVRRVVLPVRIVTEAEGLRWQRPQAGFVQPNVSLGHVHTEPDLVDGVNRRIHSAKAAEGALLPALSIAALEAVGADLDPGFQMPRVARPEVKIRFAGDTGVTFTQIPAWKVLQGDVDAAVLKDRIVLIGVTAEGLQEEDRWFTPFAIEGLKTPGVEIHANAIDTLYARRWIEDIPFDVQYFCLMGVVFLLVVMDNRFEGAGFYVTAVLMVPVLIALSWLLMKQGNLWLPFPSLLTALVLTVPGLEVWKVVRVNRDLDSKIAKLSLWGHSHSGSSQSNVMDRVLALPPSKDREAWIESIRTAETAAAHRARERSRMWASPLKTSKWRLQAVDFLNEELVRYLEFNRAVLGSIDDVTIVCDVRGTVLYQNPAATRLAGYQENPGFAPQYFAHLLDGRDFVQACAEVVGGGRSIAMPFVGGKAGGIFNVTLSPVSGTGLVLTLHDATAQHELNLAKNEMVSLVSHELRTPLTAIRGYSDMLLKYDLVQDKGRKFLGTIVEESDRLGKLIQSFLDIAYIESGRQKVSKAEFDVTPMFDDLRAVLDPVAAAKDIRLVADGGDVARVRADRMLLYQALTNLVTNAIKYSPKGTTVGVAASNGNGSISFEVHDQGFGIPPEEAGRIFDKFYRLANKETEEQAGFGLGLAFVKEVALRHGGDVTVKSEVGKGSVFTLRIPV